MAQHLAKPDAAPPPPRRGRRGRPPGDRAQAIDADIRAAARALFLELGYEAASMDAIAARAPVSKGTLYARYQGKEQLFRAVVESEVEGLSLEAGAGDHLLPGDLEGRLRHHARTIVALIGQPHFQLFSRMMEEAARTFPDLGSLREEIGTKRYLEFLIDDVAKTPEGGSMSRAQREVIANMFLHAISGWHRHESAVRVLSESEVLAFAEGVVKIIARSVAGDR